MAALLKLRNFQFRFIDFLACGVAKSSRNANSEDRQEFLSASIGEKLSLISPCEGERIKVRGLSSQPSPYPVPSKGEATKKKCLCYCAPLCVGNFSRSAFSRH